MKELVDAPLRRASLIAIALFSLLYDLRNGVVFEEETLALAEREGVVLDKDITTEIEELSRAYIKGVHFFKETIG